MKHDLEQIKQASEGLMMMSESDYPFQLIQSLKAEHTIEETLEALSDKPDGAPVEKVTLEHFFRNMTRAEPGASAEDQERARRFLHLQQVMNEELADITVYRIGTIQIDVYILGRKKNGEYAGLKTRVIET